MPLARIRTTTQYVFVEHARTTSLLLTLIAAVAIWIVFYPAIIPSDATDQYGQAKSGHYDSWHPPIMSFVLRLVMHGGLDIGFLVLLQCLAGVLGLRAAIVWEMDLFRDHRSAYTYWATTGIVLLLLSPLTATACYCVTFWKDVWTAIPLIWVLGLSFRLFHKAPQLSPARFVAEFLVLIGVMIFSGLSRHNTLTAAPVMGLLLWTILARRNIRLGWLAVGIPFVGMMVAEKGLEWALGVRKMCPTHQIKVIDLVGLYVRYPELRSDIPLTSSHLQEGILEHFRPGEMGMMAWGHPEIVSDEYRHCLLGGPIPELDEEYVNAWKKHPVAMIITKYVAFKRLVTIQAYYFHSGVDKNSHGLCQNTRFAPVRERYETALLKIMEVPVISWPSHHGFWFAVNCVLLIMAGWQMLRRRDLFAAVAVLALLMPMSYSLGYAIATTGLDYRFLLPSTLLLQIMTAGWLASLAAGHLNCRQIGNGVDNEAHN